VFEPAYIHRSNGRPGFDAGEGFAQAAELLFPGADSLEEEGVCVGAISDGSISAEGLEFANLIPLPFELSGIVRATFTFVSGGVLKVRAAGVSCVLSGSARYVEAYEG
jgi:hypothetical protein